MAVKVRGTSTPSHRGISRTRAKADTPFDFFDMGNPAVDNLEQGKQITPGSPYEDSPFDFFDFGQNPNAKNPNQLGRARAGVADAPDQGPGALTFADYLRMANEMGAGGSGPDYSAMMEQLRRNAAQGDTKLAAMYNQLRGSIDADATGIAQNYDSARSGIEQSGQQAAQQTNAGYDRAREAQTQQLAALGIGDAAAVLAGAGGNAANDQAAANANIAQDQQAGTQQAVANKASAINYNTGIGNAAGLEGAVQRAQLQQNLANKLAELETAQTQDAGNQQKSVFEQALQMAQNPGIFDPNYQGDPQDSLKAQLLAAQVTSQNLKNQGLAANSQQGIGGNLSQYQTLAQAYGVDPSDQEAFLEFIKMVNATQ